MMGDWIRPCVKRKNSLSGRPISTIMISAAKVMADTAINSEILVSGVLQGTSASLNIAVISDPTRLMATKKTKFEI
jgi:hypothetical protein